MVYDKFEVEPKETVKEAIESLGHCCNANICSCGSSKSCCRGCNITRDGDGRERWIR